eukprot:3266876-Heterocapsa_arctica.AAC.1
MDCGRGVMTGQRGRHVNAALRGRRGVAASCGRRVVAALRGCCDGRRHLRGGRSICRSIGQHTLVLCILQLFKAFALATQPQDRE